MAGKNEDSRPCVCGFGEQFFTIEGDRRICTVCGGDVGAPDGKPKEKGEDKAVGTKASGRVVLVVDDQAFFRERLRDILVEKGHVALLAENGIDCVGKIADVHVRHAPNLPERIDAVLLDMIMPGELDGMQTLMVVRKIVPDLPVLVMTANPPTRELLQKLAQCGARKYINKSSPNFGALILKNIRELR